MRFLHLIRPVMCVLPEVAVPDRKVRNATIRKLYMVLVVWTLVVVLLLVGGRLKHKGEPHKLTGVGLVHFSTADS